MSLPTSGDQYTSTRSQQPHSQPISSSAPLYTPRPLTPVTQTPLPPSTGGSHKIAQKGVTGTTAHSWDWAPGGLKTLTAKRELPSRHMQRSAEQQQSDMTAVPRSYTFALVILACIVVMLVSGGVVFFLMLQP